MLDRGLDDDPNNLIKDPQIFTIQNERQTLGLVSIRGGPYFMVHLYVPSEWTIKVGPLGVSRVDLMI